MDQYCLEIVVHVIRGLSLPWKSQQVWLQNISGFNVFFLIDAKTTRLYLNCQREELQLLPIPSFAVAVAQPRTEMSLVLYKGTCPT